MPLLINTPAAASDTPVVGQPFVARLAAPTTLVQLGARVEVPITRAIVSYWRVAALDPITGAWTVTLDAPPTAGDYLLVWRTGDPEPPDFEVFLPLTVLDGSASVDAPAALADWRPTTTEVALATPSYTHGGFDDDRVDAGAEQDDFTDYTSPNRARVEGWITSAQDEVAGRVGVTIPLRWAGLARVTVVSQVAAAIAVSKQPSGVDETSGEARNATARYLANLASLTANCKPTGPRLR